MNLAKNIAGFLTVAIGSGLLYKYCQVNEILPINGDIDHNAGIYYLGEAISLVWVSFILMHFARKRNDFIACWSLLCISWLNLCNSLNVADINEWQVGSFVMLPIIVILSYFKYKKHVESSNERKA